MSSTEKGDGPGPWMRDPRISSFRNDHLFTRREVRQWPGGGTECRLVIVVTDVNGQKKAYELTNDQDYQEIPVEKVVVDQ